MSLMPDSHVVSAQITNGKIQLSVQVDEFEANEYIEISGQATQTSGAFANIYDIQQVPAAPNVAADPKVPGDTAHYYVYVTGAPIPHQFKSNQDVTVVIRAAYVWLTVLGAQPGVQQETAGEGTVWPRLLKVSKLASGSW
jgi:hypothetical protein